VTYRKQGAYAPATRLPRSLSILAHKTVLAGALDWLHAPNRANVPSSRYGLGELLKMSGSKATAGNKHKPTHSKEAKLRDGASAVRAKRPAKGPKPKEVSREKLVCRYCGSDDLSPSFIKRRDRRCRKCFSKRYGSSARGNGTKQTK
jgi:hypothetical protein